MKGHKTAIIYVEVNDENKQIVSFSRDLVSHMITQSYDYIITCKTLLNIIVIGTEGMEY